MIENVPQTQIQFKLTPLALSEVFGEDHQELLARFNAVHDVVEDVFAGEEVSFVETHTESKASFKLWQEMLNNPRFIFVSARQKDVEVEVLSLKSSSHDITMTTESQHQTDVPAVLVDNGYNGYNEHKYYYTRHYNHACFVA